MFRKPKHIRDAKTFLAEMGIEPVDAETVGMHLEEMRKEDNRYDTRYYATPKVVEDMKLLIPSRKVYLKHELSGETPETFALRVMQAYIVCSTGKDVGYRDNYIFIKRF
ncbi:MAG: hypothetical protein AAFQ80_22755 [Cyanobacteria bacterium J06621_8]